MDQYVVTVERATIEVWRVFAKNKDEAMENYTDGNNIVAQCEGENFISVDKLAKD
jgi:hypothetical protein